MIIDCDTHLMPRDAFDGVGGSLAAVKPALKFDDQGLYADVDFPGYREVPGTSPLLAPGSGAMFKSLWEPQARMKDYDDRLGIEQHVILPQFSGWWSYLLEADLACRMARSHNEALLRLTKEYPGRILPAGVDPAPRCSRFDPRDGMGQGKRFLLRRDRQGISGRRSSVQRTAGQPP